MLTQKIKLITMLSLSLISSSFYYTLSGMDKLNPIKQHSIFRLFNSEKPYPDSISHDLNALYWHAAEGLNNKKILNLLLINHGNNRNISQKNIKIALGKQEENEDVIEPKELDFKYSKKLFNDELKKIKSDFLKVYPEAQFKDFLELSELHAAKTLSNDIIIRIKEERSLCAISILTSDEELYNIALLAMHLLDNEEPLLENILAQQPDKDAVRKMKASNTEDYENFTFLEAINFECAIKTCHRNAQKLMSEAGISKNFVPITIGFVNEDGNGVNPKFTENKKIATHLATIAPISTRETTTSTTEIVTSTITMDTPGVTFDITVSRRD